MASCDGMQVCGRGVPEQHSCSTQREQGIRGAASLQEPLGEGGRTKHVQKAGPLISWDISPPPPGQPLQFLLLPPLPGAPTCSDSFLPVMESIPSPRGWAATGSAISRSTASSPYENRALSADQA